MTYKFAIAAVGALLLASPGIAADMPEYHDVTVPPVDYNIGGSFYLRGSAGLNWHWAKTVTHPLISDSYEPVEYGYGYSVGAGFGYETGTGLRFDTTIDQVETRGLKITKDTGDVDVDGDYTLMLRSTLALANIYYDFGLSGSGPGNGTFAYVGAGAGVAWNHAEVNSPTTAAVPVPTGGNVSVAAAVMAGIGYDMGSWVADIGYRGIYIDKVANEPTTDANQYYEVNNSFISEVRGTVRYRFN